MTVRAGRSPRWTIAVAAVVAFTGSLDAQELVVDRDSDRLARFVSETTLESFDGRTEAIDGYAWLGEDRGVEEFRAGESFPDGSIYFEVDLASVRTGISLRDRHMREDYLETDEHPFAIFEGEIASVTDHPEGGLRVTTPGTFSLHGVDRTRTIDCRVTREARGLRVRCAFTVTLQDHDIEIPQVMFLKLAEQVRVELDFHLKTSGESP